MTQLMSCVETENDPFVRVVLDGPYPLSEEMLREWNAGLHTSELEILAVTTPHLFFKASFRAEGEVMLTQINMNHVRKAYVSAYGTPVRELVSDAVRSALALGVDFPRSYHRVEWFLRNFALPAVATA
jgi:hypothetical protein